MLGAQLTTPPQLTTLKTLPIELGAFTTGRTPSVLHSRPVRQGNLPLQIISHQPMNLRRSFFLSPPSGRPPSLFLQSNRCHPSSTCEWHISSEQRSSSNERTNVSSARSQHREGRQEKGSSQTTSPIYIEISALCLSQRLAHSPFRCHQSLQTFHQLRNQRTSRS